jgi:guanylate kinase
MQGKLIIFSAPSGAGKTTLVRNLLSSGLPLSFSVSATSRSPREGEINGREYYFLSGHEFRDKIEKGDFLEWEEVYPGMFYGTLLSELNRIWNEGKHVVFDVDVVGGLNIKKKFPKNSLSVFVMPPSLEVLEGRLIDRNTETPESLEKRISKARLELSFSQQFDAIIVNDHLDTSFRESLSLVQEFLQSP